MNRFTSGTLVALAAASLFGSACKKDSTGSAPAPAQETAPAGQAAAGSGDKTAPAAGDKTAGTPAATAATVRCAGVNECKGKSSCDSANNACAGQNDCKGKGWLSMSAADCKSKGGTVLAGK